MTKLLWTFLLCALPAAASAQSVVVLIPAQTEPGVASAEADRATTAIARRLEADGYRVIGPQQAAAAVAADEQGGDGAGPGAGAEAGGALRSPHDCTRVDCAVKFGEFFEAEFAIQTSLYRKLETGAEGAGSVGVSLVESASVHSTGRANIVDGDVEVAALTALTAARKQRSGTSEQWLTISGGPDGARVSLDGEETGRLPYRQRVAVGTHRLEVSAEGHVAQSQQIELASGLDAELAVQVHLPLADTEPVRATAKWDWIAGGTLAAGGIVLAATAGGLALAKQGECVDSRCEEFYDTGTGTWAQISIGLGTALVGTVMMVTKPIQLYLSGSPDTAMLRARGSF